MSHVGTRWFGALLASALAGLIASSIAKEHTSWAATAQEGTARTAIPMLVPEPYLSMDADLPPAVKQRLEGVIKDLSGRAKAAAQIPATTANGCVSSGLGSGPSSLGAPAPRIDARILGHHVEVVFDFPRMPQSPACRPFELAVVVYSGSKASPTFKNFVQRYWLEGSRGRVALDLPWGGRAPYHVLVTAATILGRRGPAVEQRLRCPRTGHAVRGCLPGYRPSAHAYPMPAPVLPVRGVERSALEASLRYALAGEQRAPIVNAVPRSSRCPTLTACIVTYVDPAFPDSAYRVRYRIAGQQIRGCWMAMRQGPLDARPFSDAFTGRLELAACASWVG